MSSKPGCGLVGVYAVLGTLLGACLLVFNIISISGIVSGVKLGMDAAAGKLTYGIITDAYSHTVHSDRGPDETYCFGTFTSEDGTVRNERVRVYQKGYCFKARRQRAVWARGLAAPIAIRIVDPDDSAMPFNGLFGMVDGAVLSWGAFVKGLWPFSFLVGFSLLGDYGVMHAIRSRRRERRRHHS